MLRAFAGKALRGAFGIAGHLTPNFLLPRLDADPLIKAAGVSASVAAREGLAQLMAALAKDSELSLFGRASVKWDMLRLLRNAAQIEHAHRQNPALAAAPVVAPLFILGLPRSGTSFLHALLAEDPGTLVPRTWQTLHPRPRPADFNPAQDKSAKAVNRQLRLFAALAPGFASLHPIHADSPQECSEITAHVFQSLRFDTTFRVPDYLAWLDSHGDLAGFEFHRKFLQYLQNGKPGRWVLKCPDHTFSLSAILQVYPDARFVIVHRDPAEVFASVASLTEVLRRPFLRNVDPAEIGRQVSARWLEGTSRLIAFDQRADIDPARKFHIQHDALVTAPLAAVASIYRQFDIPQSAAAATAMARSLATRPRGGYAKHPPYAVQKFAVSPEWLRDNFAGYVNAYCSAAR